MSCSLPRWRRARFAAVFALGVVCLSAAPAAAQVTWTLRGPTVPIARIENAMVYDQANQRMVMFGGYDLNFNRTNDIWEYNGAARVWTNVTPASGAMPSPRQGAAMAYDPVRQRILLFGGSDDAGTVLGDTWRWDAVAKTWTLLSPAGPPPVRVGSRMVYDVAGDRIILQGGWNSTTSVHFGDTWAFNPAAGTWTNLGSLNSSAFGRSFSQRTYHGLVYNTTNNRVTIFGGRGPAGDLNDLWELNPATNTWVDIAPAGAPPFAGRGWSGVTYESANSRLVFYGGFSVPGGFSFQDTWAWNGASWTQLANGPTARDSHQMVWDLNRAVSVVFGGAANDVRELSGNTWSGAISQQNWPLIQDEHSIAFDAIDQAGHGRFFLFGGGDGARVWETFAFGQQANGATRAWRSPWIVSGGPGGRIGHAMVHEGPARDRVILFGGRQRTPPAGSTVPQLGTVFGDTWAFTRPPGNGGPFSWTSLSGGPPARYDHAMAYDALRDQTVMFGGRNAAGTALGDTWVWSGSSSSWAPAAGGPPARFDQAMAYDNARGVIVMFGGDNGTSKLGDTWEWNGSAWTLRSSSGPPARAGAALSWYGSSSGGVVLFGGRAQSSALLNDQWIWTGSSWFSVAAVSPPSPRVNSRMLWDPFEHYLWLYGGLTASGRSGELRTATVNAVVALPAFSVSDVSVTETNVGTNATFTVSLSPAPSSTATVQYATANGTATAGSDYTATAGTLTFIAGQTSATVSVPVTGDLVDEDNETFFLNLSSPSNATIADGQGQATIVDDDPILSVNDVTVAEGNSGTVNAVFTVTLTGASSRVITVNVQTADGTAVSGIDYGIVVGTLTFYPGGTTQTQTVTVPVIGDRVFEADETFVLNLSGATNAVITDAQGVGTITNDDVPGLSIDDVVAVEGTNARFTVTLSPVNPTQTVTVNYTTANGTATAPADYQTTTGTLTFTPGTPTRPITVPVALDNLVELTQTFVVNLTGATNAAIAGAQGVATVVDPGGGADFNADGKTDILWRNQAGGDDILWLMNGTAIAAGAVLTKITDPNWVIAGAADFNADHQPDILWRNQATGENQVWFMSQLLLTGGAVLTTVPTSWRIGGTGDFNADGKPDILWRNYATGDNVVWFMDGTNIAGSALLPAIADVNWIMAGAGDFNADGKTDIVWRHRVTGDNVVWFMNGASLTGGAFLTAIGDPNWVVGGVGDFNADGRTDILWRNQSTGENIVWFLNGTSISGGVFLTPISDPNWRIVAPR